MARRRTRLLRSTPADVRVAAEILRVGGLVAFPTETVYGLGANALDARAVRGIFEAKARPADDPVIVHIAQISQLEAIARPTDEALRLAERFWPGPLTLVLPKQAVVPVEVTAGLESVGVRIPSHPVAQALLAAADLPIAAPSANLFGRPSPTRASHVVHDLEGRIDAVLDGGATQLGLESTIIDLSSPTPRLLRPGGLAAEAVEDVLGAQLQASSAATRGPQPAPGMLPVHYSPRTPLVLIRGASAADRLVREVAASLRNGKRVGVVALGEDLARLPADVRVERVGAWSMPEASAARLFDALRALDTAGLDVLYVRELADPSRGLGRALDDRLRRASRQVLDTES